MVDSGSVFQTMDLDQFRKILDLLEHPPESGPVREALDRYNARMRSRRAKRT